MKLIECPRDAIQGIKHFISTEKKARYINQLLQVGFDTIDFGSFVSPRLMPQLSDTAKVLSLLDFSKSQSRLLAIVANERGAAVAAAFREIACLGFPFSISETFQKINTGSTIAKSVDRVSIIQDLCLKHNKQLVIYISMGFGNPFGDTWNEEITLKWVEKLKCMGVDIFSLSDTVGIANPRTIKNLFGHLTAIYPDIEFGAHFHTKPNAWREKIDAAWTGGCRRFDGAILGFGGCPMAGNKLVGNMPTERLVEYMAENGIPLKIDSHSIKDLQISFQQLISS